MIYILLVISVLVNLVTILYYFKSGKMKGGGDEILTEILDLCMKDDIKFIDSSANNIIKVLKKYYKIDDCSILINDDGFKIIASNVDDYYKGTLEEYCQRSLSKLKGAAIIDTSENFLSYPSADRRKIKYSYMIKLGTIGAIFIENRTNYKDNDKFELDFFKLVIKNIIIVLQNCIYQDKISKLAMKDNLTMMFNRNYMDKHIQDLINSGNKLVVAIMDIDHFKSVNDNYGHDFGDLVLIKTSKFIKSKLSEDDEIYRWGGEEFVISFSGQNIKDVEYKLNKIRESLSKLAISNNKSSISVTASFGVAEFRESINATVKDADKALYQSKESGRNKVTVYN